MMKATVFAYFFPFCLLLDAVAFSSRSRAGATQFSYPPQAFTAKEKGKEKSFENPSCITFIQHIKTSSSNSIPNLCFLLLSEDARISVITVRILQCLLWRADK